MTQPQFICFLEPARKEMPDNPTPEEAEIVGQHFNYYSQLHKSGTLILAGRTQEPPHIGIMIFEAKNKAAAQTVVNNDPAITAGVFIANLQSYMVALHQKI